MMIARRSMILGGIAVTVGLADPALAQTQPPEVAKLREELMTLEKGSWGFVRDKDYEGMKNFLPEDAVLIFADGTRVNKRQMLDLMKDFKVESFTIELTYAVRMVSPDVATLLYRITNTSSIKGGPTQTSMALASSLYVRREGKWWSVLYQETPIK